MHNIIEINHGPLNKNSWVQHHCSQMQHDIMHNIIEINHGPLNKNSWVQHHCSQMQHHQSYQYNIANMLS